MEFIRIYDGIPSGYVKIATEHGYFIVDFAIKNCVFP